MSTKNEVTCETLMRLDFEERVRDLRKRAAEIAGEEGFSWLPEDASPAAVEEFWRSALAFEEAEEVQPFDVLVDGGQDLPAADDLDDEALDKKLWEVLSAMQCYGIFLERTNHLSNRELYTHLWEDCLREPMVLPMNEDGPLGHWIVDLIGGGCPEAIQTDLRYYADENQRREWAERFPDDEIPDHEDPPHDRDRLLPRPY